MSTVQLKCGRLPENNAASIFKRDPQTADQEQARRDKSNPGEFIHTNDYRERHPDSAIVK